MEVFGRVVVFIIMGCAAAGMHRIESFGPESELGKEFVAGIDSIGPIFLPVAGIMASAPYLTAFVSTVFGPLFGALGADPAMAATTFIAVDMGGYQLADALAQTRESWIMAMMTGYMAGATIVFTVPVALKMLEVKDRKYLALGVMSGLLAIPIGVLVASAIIALANPVIRETVSTNAAATYQLALTWSQIAHNLVPLIIICVALAVGLATKPDAMIRGFIVFGRALDSVLKVVFAVVVIEYFTGLFSTIFGSFGFDPIIADEQDQFRALEVSGAIGMMLCGAFPMVWLIKTYLAKPLSKIGRAGGPELRRHGRPSRRLRQRTCRARHGQGPQGARQGHRDLLQRVLRLPLWRSPLVHCKLPAHAYRARASGQARRRRVRDLLCYAPCHAEGRGAGGTGPCP
jgi:ethanolamine transporter